MFMFEALSLDLPGEPSYDLTYSSWSNILSSSLNRRRYSTVSAFGHHSSWQFMNFLSPIAPAFCSARCPWPHCSSWFWQMWGFGVGLFHLCILCHFCPSNRANLFQQTRTGHSLPWKSWPEGLALAFGWPHERQWCLLPSPMSDHGFWDTFLSKPPDEGENLLLWECWACQIWNEMGLSTVNINSTNPVMGGLFSLP